MTIRKLKNIPVTVDTVDNCMILLHGAIIIGSLEFISTHEDINSSVINMKVGFVLAKQFKKYGDLREFKSCHGTESTLGFWVQTVVRGKYPVRGNFIYVEDYENEVRITSTNLYFVGHINKDYLC